MAQIWRNWHQTKSNWQKWWRRKKKYPSANPVSEPLPTCSNVEVKWYINEREHNKIYKIMNKKQRLRSACISTQADQSSLMDVQADLSLCSTCIWFLGFIVRLLKSFPHLHVMRQESYQLRDKQVADKENTAYRDTRPCCCGLCQVFGNLPVDVQPEKRH